jgi:hypothetical protein
MQPLKDSHGGITKGDHKRDVTVFPVSCSAYCVDEIW